MKPAARVALLVLSVVTGLHVLRLMFQVPVTAGTVEIPMWASVLAVIGLGALVLWFWKEQQA